MIAMKNIFQSLYRYLNEFSKCRKGLAATEFALVVPVMLLFLYLGLEGTEYSSADDRVKQAADTLVDIVAKQPQISATEIDDLFIGVENVIQPIDIRELDMIIVSVVPSPSGGPPIVAWSRSNNPGSPVPYTPGSVYNGLENGAILQNNFSLLVSEVNYNHKSGLTGQYIGETIEFNIKKVRAPRRSVRVELCDLNPENIYINCIS